MAVAFKTESHDTAVATTTVVTKPTGTVDDDLLIAMLMRDGGTDIINSVPSGWTLLEELAGGSGNILYVYGKIASSEGASWTWGWNGSDVSKRWAAFRFDGTLTVIGDAIDVSAIAEVDNDATPSFTNTITPTADDGMIVMMVFSSQDATSVSAYAVTTDNPTFTERLDNEQSNFVTAMATATRSQQTATGNSSATIDSASGTEDTVCCILSILQFVNVTVSPAVIDNQSFSVIDPTVTGGATVTPAVIALASSIPAPTVNLVATKWQTTAKSNTSPTVSNTSKS